MNLHAQRFHRAVPLSALSSQLSPALASRGAPIVTLSACRGIPGGIAGPVRHIIPIAAAARALPTGAGPLVLLRRVGLRRLFGLLLLHHLLRG